MFLRIECPGCNAVLQVEESLAGKQGKCIHCGHKIIVPSQSGMAHSVPVPPPPPVPFLTEASPEAMIRELHERRKSALLLVFEPSPDGSYDLADIPDNKLKCVATEDITLEKFAELVDSFSRRFVVRKPAAPVAETGSGAAASAPAAPAPPQGSMVGKLSGTVQGPDDPYEIKGDQLGMSMADFKAKYARFTPDGRQDLPICSDMPGYIGKADLHGEAWHRRANIVHARVDIPVEENSPTVAGVKTDLFLYQFVDGHLYRISAWFATDLFHVVSEAVLQKFGRPTYENKQPRELVWENNVSKIVLARGTVHPRTYSTMHLVHKQLTELAASRAPRASEDI